MRRGKGKAQVPLLAGLPSYTNCRVEGGVSGDAPTSRDRPLPQTCNPGWVQNRSLRDCRQAEIARDHLKTHAIAIRPLRGNTGLLAALARRYYRATLLGTEERTA
jgi:hypothetical protein